MSTRHLRMSSANAALGVLALLLFSGGMNRAEAVTSFSWDGSVDSQWSTPGNWTPPGPPTAADDVTIDGLSYGVNPDPVLDVNADCNTLNILGSGQLTVGTFMLTVTGGVSVDLGSTILVDPTGVLVVGGACGWDDGSTLGTVSMPTGATLVLDGAAPQTLPSATYSDVEYAGTSVLTFAGGTALLDNFSIFSGTFTIASGNLVVGANVVTVTGSTLNISTGAELEIDGGVGSCVWGTGAGALNMDPSSTLRFVESGGHVLPGGGYADLIIEAPASEIGGDVWADSVTVNVPGGLDISAGWFSVQDVYLQAGTFITVGAGQTLYVGGVSSWGSAAPGGEVQMDAGTTLDLDGVGIQTLPSQPTPYADVVVGSPSVSPDGNVTMDNLTVNSGASLGTSGYTVTVLSDVTIDSGATLAVQSGGFTLVVGGACNWNGVGGFTGTLTMDPGTLLRLNGTLMQMLPDGVYADVEIQNSLGVQLNGNVTMDNLILELGGTLNTNLSMLTVTGNIVVPFGEAGTIIALLPTGSPAPPGDYLFPAVTANDLLLDAFATLTLDGQGRVALQQLTLPMDATLNASQGTPSVSDDGILQVDGDWFNDGTFVAGVEGEVVMSGAGNSTIWGSVPVTFYDLSLQKSSTATVTANADIEIGGSFSVSGSAIFVSMAMFTTVGAGSVDVEDYTAGTVTFSNLITQAAGGTFLGALAGPATWVVTNGLNVAFPLELDADSTLDLSNTVTGTDISNYLNVNAGTIIHQATAASFDVNSGGTLDLGPSGVFVLAAPVALFVNTGGTLDGNMGGSLIVTDAAAYVEIDGGSFITPPGGSAVFASGTPGTIPLSFEVFDGLLDLQSGVFNGLGMDGLLIDDLAMIINLADVSFINSTPGGKHITVYRNESSGPVTLTWTDLVMDDSFGLGSGNNIFAENGGTSSVTIDVSTATGLGIGDAYEDEASGTVTINWGAGGGGGGGSPSTTEFTDASGSGMTDYVVGVNDVFVTVTDTDQDTDSGLVETLQVTILANLNSDSETVTLTETGVNTGVFRNATGIPMVLGSAVPEDGTLEVCSSCVLLANYTDPDDFIDMSSDTANVQLSGGGGAGLFIGEVNPNFGLTSGGTYIEIEGEGFDSGTTVTIAGSPASSVNVASSSLITCYSPSGSSGPASLIVANSGGDSDSRVFFYSTPSSVTGTAPSGTSAADYGMVSIPGFITSEDLFGALESSLGPWDPTQWRAFKYEPDFGGYEEITPWLSYGDHSSPTGHAFWLLSRNGGSVSVNTLTTATAPDVEVHHQAGWNQIGNPYTVAVSWGSVLVQDINPSTGVPDGPPVPTGSSTLIDPTLFYWDGSDYVSASTLVPGAGYWMYNGAGHEIELIYQNPGGATKPTWEPETSPLRDPSVIPPPPPGATLSATGGSGGSTGGSSAGGTTYFSGASSGGGTTGGSSGGGGGGGGGGGCWVGTAAPGHPVRGLVLMLLALGVIGLAAARARRG